MELEYGTWNWNCNMDFKYGIELKLEYGTGKNVWNANTKSN